MPKAHNSMAIEIKRAAADIKARYGVDAKSKHALFLLFKDRMKRSTLYRYIKIYMSDAAPDEPAAQVEELSSSVAAQGPDGPDTSAIVQLVRGLEREFATSFFTTALPAAQRLSDAACVLSVIECSQVATRLRAAGQHLLRCADAALGRVGS